MAPAVPEKLRLAWEHAALAAVAPEPPPRPLPKQYAPSHYVVLIPCRDEPHQIELLTRFHAEGIECRALQS